MTHTNLNPGLTGIEIFCLLHYTSPHVFLQWVGLKCLFVTLGLCYLATGHMKSQGPMLNNTDGFSSFTTPRGKLLIHRNAPQGLVFWWPPPFTVSRQKQHKLCRTQGRGERHFTRLILLVHQTWELLATRGSGALLKFWCRIAAVWALILTL